MQYIKTHWIHEHPDEPVWIYSELDAERWELRKLEVFPDGSLGHADVEGSNGRSWLGEMPVPPFDEVDVPGELETVEIDAAEFEALWARRSAPAPALLGGKRS